MVSAKELMLFARTAAVDAVRLYFDPVTRLSPLRQRTSVNVDLPNQVIRKPLRIFISDTKGESERRDAVERWLRTTMNAEILTFSVAGHTPKERLETMLGRSDHAIFFLGGDLSAADEWGSASRDNVIFELGMAVGALGRTHVSVIVAEGNYESANNLDDLHLISGSADLHEMESKLHEALREAEGTSQPS